MNMNQKVKCTLKPAVGLLRISPEAQDRLTPDDVSEALGRHFCLDETEHGEPTIEQDLRDLGSIVSKHTGANGIEFCVVSEPGSTVLTVLMPGERN